VPESVPCCTVETSSLEHSIPHCRRKSTLDTQTSQSDLSLADTMHQFDTGDRNRRGREALEAQHRGDSLFHAPMSCSIRLFSALSADQANRARDCMKSFIPQVLAMATGEYDEEKKVIVPAIKPILADQVLHNSNLLLFKNRRWNPSDNCSKATRYFIHSISVCITRHTPH
jgi:hypothetical protein